MARIWTLGGLSVPELLRRTWIESWTDAVYGQAGRMAFYHFLAIFPSLLIFLAFTETMPSIGPGVKSTAAGLIQEILPSQAAGLVQQMLTELQRHTPAGFALISACGGALWAALNGTWALVFGLNTAYEVEESRGWWKLGTTIAGLTLVLTVAASLALIFLFSAAHIGGQVFRQPASAILRALEWLVVLATLMFSFAVVYRFAPNLRDAEWKWSTPGSTCALLLWVASTIGLRFYFEHISNYYQTYGHLNTVVMLLLWLYFTNAAILIGGEMNSEIEKAAAASTSPQKSDRTDELPRRRVSF